MLNDMTIDQKSTTSPSHKLDTQDREKFKQQQTENHELFCAPRGKYQKSPQNTQNKERLQTLHSPVYSKETTKQLWKKKVANQGHYQYINEEHKQQEARKKPYHQHNIATNRLRIVHYSGTSAKKGSSAGVRRES
jgi:hypothetical protein